MSTALVPLDLLGREIKASIDAGDRAASKAEDHYISAGQRLVEAKARVEQDGGSFRGFLAEHGIGKSRAYDILAVVDGRKTFAGIRAKDAERQGRKSEKDRDAIASVSHGQSERLSAPRAEEPFDVDNLKAEISRLRAENERLLSIVMDIGNGRYVSDPEPSLKPMKIKRQFTKAAEGPYARLKFKAVKVEDGTEIVVPVNFSQVAADILAQKFFRRGDVPARLKKIGETDVPAPIQRLEADIEAMQREGVAEHLGSETDARQVFDRLAGTWTYWGWKGGYFSSEADALAFRDELAYMLATQRVAPNSPQWFNAGLHWAYGIDDPGQSHFYVDPLTGKLTKSESVSLGTVPQSQASAART